MRACVCRRAHAYASVCACGIDNDLSDPNPLLHIIHTQEYDFLFYLHVLSMVPTFILS